MKKLEDHKIFPYVAWTLIAVGAFSTFVLTRNLQQQVHIHSPNEVIYADLRNDLLEP